MKSPEIIAFNADHLEGLEPRENIDMSLVRHYATTVEIAGPAFSAVRDGRILGCAGVAKLWHGVGEAWTVLGPEACTCGFWFHRTVRRMLGDIIDELGLIRLQAMVLADSERNNKWIKRLGFSFEGRMPKFGPDGKDYNRYAIVRG